MNSTEPIPDADLTSRSRINPLLDPEWLSRFQSASGTHPDRYLLSNPGDIIVTEQLHCYVKAEKKFPVWHCPGLVYTRLALEQSSGEIAARFKSGLMHGTEIWDLTGGLGMDTYAFSQSFDSVHYCEPAEQPFILARHNHTVLGADSIQHHMVDAASAIELITHTDWIYLDPSRRDQSGRKFLLRDCEPDVLQLLDLMRQKASGIMIKLSPMYDLHRLVEEIPSITRIYVVSVHGEVREILALIDGDAESRMVTAVVLPEEITYSASFPGRRSVAPTQPASQQSEVYLQVADASIFKAGLAGQVMSEHQGSAFGSGGYFLTSNSHVPGCKSYKVLHEMDYKPKELRKKLKNARVNIHKRNFSIEISDIYKALGTAMGDDLHLFFTQRNNGQKMVALCKPPVIRA